MRRKFAVFYCAKNPDREKAGNRYKPPRGKMLVMNADGVFFQYDSGPFYPYIKPLVDVIGNFDVIWNDPIEEEVGNDMDGYNTLRGDCWGTTSPTIVYPSATTKEEPVKTPITAFMDEELEAELKRRREAREAARRPVPSADPDFTVVVDYCAKVVCDVAEVGYYDEDYRAYVFEAAMKAIYGKDVFKWVREKMGDD